MQRRACHPAVLSRGKHHQKTAGVEIGGGKPPFGQVMGIVGQAPAVQVHRARAGVVDFDPVIEGTVLVAQRVRVVGHEFREDHRAGRMRHGPQRQSAQEQQRR